ncbi:MAG: aspartate aminotransferase family protein [Anaerolineae bacterium]
MERTNEVTDAAVTKTIWDTYVERFPRSRELAERAGHVITRRVTHDSRYMQPFPLYAVRALGSHKWDADGYEYVDYAGGHGSHLLGHAFPAIVEAVQRQMPLGTHLGSSHEQEIVWAELITRLIPCAERVEFTMSGTESVMLAVRIARAYTGRDKIVKFKGHFHGWYDQVHLGLTEPFDEPASLGITDGVRDSALVLPPNDIEAVRSALARGDVAAVILEPGGASAGRLPSGRPFLEALRQETTKAGVVLIFDEVITGFRYSPGGAQEYYGITPDVTTLGKIVGGGMPAAAVCGKAEFMSVLDWDRGGGPGPTRLAHTGTYNASPIVAAAGVAMLREVATGVPTRRANENGAALRAALSDVVERTGVSASVYGECSLCNIHIAPPELCPPVGADGLISPDFPIEVLLRGKSGRTAHLKRALALEGVDILSDHLWISAVHNAEDVQLTAQAFEKALQRMLAEDLAPRR